MRFLCHSIVKKVVLGTALVAAFLLLFTVASSLPALDDAADSPGESYGQHLHDHRDEIRPFLKQHQAEIYQEGQPQFLIILAEVLALNLVVGWIFDLVSAYYLSRFFAPSYAKGLQAISFATGHQVLLLVLTLIILALAFTIGTLMPWYLFIVTIILLLLAFFIVQTIWVSFNYQTGSNVSGQFYLAVLAFHAVALLICYPIERARTVRATSALVNQVATPQINNYVGDRKHVLALAEEARDKVQGEIADTQAQLAQANANQIELRKEIADRKASEFYVFCRIVHLHAEGDLTTARDQLNDFFIKFPAGKFLDPAKAQLAQIESELAVQEAQRKQAEADAAQVAAQVKADFLARAGRGEIPLSEMHQKLLGKSPADVTDLLGKPSMIQAGQWTYVQQMVNNPLTQEKHGLTIYFVDGFVQSVDFFFGGGE